MLTKSYDLDEIPVRPEHRYLFQLVIFDGQVFVKAGAVIPTRPVVVGDTLGLAAVLFVVGGDDPLTAP